MHKQKQIDSQNLEPKCSKPLESPDQDKLKELQEIGQYLKTINYKIVGSYLYHAQKLCIETKTSFIKWLKENCDFSRATAYRYIKAYRTLRKKDDA